MDFIFTDINECDNGGNSCHVNAICSNVPGSYVCRCIRGFQGDGRICVGNFSYHNHDIVMLDGTTRNQYLIFEL